MEGFTVSEFISFFTEDNIVRLLEKFRALGPLPGIFLAFMKSFIPPLPTLLIVGANGLVYGWVGFLYSWIGLVGGSFVTFMVIRKLAGTRWASHWAERPKVQKSLIWIRRNAFSYVFLLGMFPVGPFVLVNMAAGISQMRPRSFLLAATLGKGIMVFYVTFIGTNLVTIMEQPLILVGILMFIGCTIWISRKIERYYTGPSKIQ